MDFVVFIPTESSSDLGAMMEWATEQQIKMIRANVKHSEHAFGRPIIYGFFFEFENIEDALAFKLRWF